MGIWDFIQQQILGMQWLNDLIATALTAMGLDVSSRVGGEPAIFLLRRREDYRAVMRTDLCHLLRTKLLST